MRVILQKVKEAKVEVNHHVIGQIQEGVLLYVGLTHNDTKETVMKLANKIPKLRIYEDENDKMNRSLLDKRGQILSVSQFTLYGCTKKGNRPSFTEAMKPEKANQLYDYFNQLLREKGIHVQTGQFGAHMEVFSLNDGPVTFILEE